MGGALVSKFWNGFFEEVNASDKPIIKKNPCNLLLICQKNYKNVEIIRFLAFFWCIAVYQNILLNDLFGAPKSPFEAFMAF